MLKTLVRRSCGGEAAPNELRMQIMAHITTLIAVTVELPGLNRLDLSQRHRGTRKTPTPWRERGSFQVK